MLPGDCLNITLYYYSKHEVWLLRGEKVLIREISLNVYATEMLNSNRKIIAYFRFTRLLLILPLMSYMFAFNCLYDNM